MWSDILIALLGVAAFSAVFIILRGHPDCYVCGAKNGEPCQVPPGRVCPWRQEKELDVRHRSIN